MFLLHSQNLSFAACMTCCADRAGIRRFLADEAGFHAQRRPRPPPAPQSEKKCPWHGFLVPGNLQTLNIGRFRQYLAALQPLSVKDNEFSNV